MTARLDAPPSTAVMADFLYASEVEREGAHSYTATGELIHRVVRAPSVAPDMKAPPSHRPAPTCPGVYFVRFGSNVKIGKASNVRSRIAGLQTSHADLLDPLLVLMGDEKEERTLHKRFGAIRVRGEWFRFEGALLRFVEQVWSTEGMRGVLWRALLPPREICMAEVFE